MPVQGTPEQVGPFVCTTTPINLETNCESACEGLFPDPPLGVGLADSDITDDTCIERVGGSCTGWNPSNAVTVDGSGVMHLDETFVADLIADPSPLRDCDNAFFEGLSTAGFELDHADGGELLYELGLRDGDVPLTLNGKPLDDYVDVLAAYIELYVYSGATEYTLVVRRGVNNVTLEYEIDT